MKRWVVMLSLACVSCTASGSDQAAPSGGAGGVGGALAEMSAAGSSAPFAGTSGGSGGIGGEAAAGVAASGGAGGMQAGAGGAAGVIAEPDAGHDSGGGGGGDAGPDGGGASGHVAVASEGCGTAVRPGGGEVIVPGSHIYSFPESYDGSTPMPLIMAFHAANNGNDQLRNITRGSALDEHFVMAFPKSAGSGWSPDADGQSIDARYEELRSSYCIDESRVFATGHSSGAQLIVQFMCSGDERFRAIAPVASSAYCPSWESPIPALIIHGVDDMERARTNQDADGRKDLAPYLLSNHCAMTSVSHDQAGCSSGGMQVDPGCVQYDGCAEQTIWCHHDDPQYGTTNHGWPCFANDAMDAFFTALP